MKGFIDIYVTVISFSITEINYSLKKPLIYYKMLSYRLV